ncbi:hypothetical protein ILYODFUR_035082 [Ilyodon furcidens]|uniref:Uncharacterized protein n=1 Tax=Ilyodon furcidens TaxID=33524 RepID=A0ABV0VJM3_9TELE
MLPQPKHRNLRRNLVWFNLQLTAQYQFLQTSEPCSPSTSCSPQTHQVICLKFIDTEIALSILTEASAEVLTVILDIHRFRSSINSVLPGSASFFHADLYSSKP